MHYCIWIINILLLFHLETFAQAALATNKLTSFGVTIIQEIYRGKPAITLEQAKALDRQTSVALLNQSNFQNGAIELLISGDIGPKAIEGARGFVGVAFGAQDTAKFELIIRPENGRAPDQVRRNHSTQYVSCPDCRGKGCAQSFRKNMNLTLTFNWVNGLT